MRFVTIYLCAHIHNIHKEKHEHPHNYCINSSFLTAHNCCTLLFSPFKSQYSANPAALMQTWCRAVGFLQCCYCTHITATKDTVHPLKLSCHTISVETRSRPRRPHVHWHQLYFCHRRNKVQTLCVRSWYCVFHLDKVIRCCSHFILWIYDVVKC